MKKTLTATGAKVGVFAALVAWLLTYQMYQNCKDKWPPPYRSEYSVTGAWTVEIAGKRIAASSIPRYGEEDRRCA
jgi:hypothetical protein